jgi:8-oxo-dGTP pyrophosphatase MutT (NUDIX family)
MPDVNDSLPERLARRLTGELPGWQAQSAYQPELSFGRHRGPAPNSAIAAAVLVLLYPRDGQWHLPLIVRPANMPAHAGQVSLPGGVIEAGEDSRQAALRECAEELGVLTSQVEVLGRLSDLYLFASNFRITPWVGVSRSAPAWNPNPREVDEVLEVPLFHLQDPANSGRMERVQRRVSFLVPCFHWETHRVWGATSMILAERVAASKDCGA